MEIDALPYVDKLFDQDEAIRQQVQALIAAEEAKIKGDKEQYVQHVPLAESFTPKSTLLQSEMIRKANGAPLDSIALDRYDLDRFDLSKMTLKSAEEAIRNLKIQIEYQRSAGLNLELLSSFGVDAWKARGLHLEEDLAALEKQVHEVKSRTNALNRERKKEHVAAKKQLDSLGEEWVTLVNSAIQTKVACAELQNNTS